MWPENTANLPHHNTEALTRLQEVEFCLSSDLTANKHQPRFCRAEPVRTGNSQVRTRRSTHARGHLPDAGLGGTCRLADRGESGTFSRLPGIPATARGFSTSPQIRGPEEGSQSWEVKTQIQTAGWIRSSALSLCLHTHTHTQKGSQLRKSRLNAPTEVARG